MNHRIGPRLRALFLGSLFLAQGALALPPLVIRNVDVVSMISPEILRDRTVLIRDGVIVSVEASDKVSGSRGATVVDGRGKFLIPGMCDMHVHLGDLEAGEMPDSSIAQAIHDSRGELALYLRSGITCVRNMGGSAFHLALAKELDVGTILGPRMSTTSPIVDGDPPVWPFAEKITDLTQARALVQGFKAQGYDAVKVYNGLSRDAYFAIIVAAREAGLKVVGHVPFSVGIWGAMAAGQQSVEHFRGYDFNPDMAPGTSKAGDRFSWWFSLKDDDLHRLARATADAGIYNVPTLNLMELAIDGEARERLAERPLVAKLPPGLRGRIVNDTAVKLFSSDVLKAMRDSLPIQQRLLRYMLEEGAPIMAGTDTPALGAIPGDALQRELELIAEAGASNYQALRAATVVPAEYFERLDRMGTVEAGKQADLVLLDADPLQSIGNIRKVSGVVLRGQWLSAEVLEQDLAEAASP